MRKIATIAALAASLFATPGAARPQPSIWTSEQLACPSKQASAGLLKAMVDASLQLGAQLSRDNLGQVVALAASCGKSTGVAASQLQSYRGYVIERLSSDGLGREMAALGVPTSVVDQVLDIGPGRANLPIEKLTTVQAEKLFAVLEARRIDTDKLPEKVWGLVGPYAAITSQMYRRTKPGG